MSKTGIAFIDLSAQRRRLGARIDRAVARVLDHGRFILGPEVAELEERLQTFSGARHCITCANGTDAIELALSALNIGPGDGVVVPAFSYVATAEAVLRVGAVPIFADVDMGTFNLCPTSTEAAIKVGKDLGLTARCIMPVDLFGQPADYAAMREIARAHDLKIVADAAQSFGARQAGHGVGSLADITTTSFYPSKPLGCYGDGGAIFTDDAALTELLRSLRCHGQGSGGGFVRVGRNSRLDTVQAAVLIEKLSAFEDEIEMRSAVADRYAQRLAAPILAPEVVAGNTSVWAQYTVRVPDARDDVVAACRAGGVPIAVHYATPLHRLPPYRHCPAAPRLERAEALSREVFSLPMHADLDERTQDIVIETMHRAISGRASKSLHAHA